MGADRGGGEGALEQRDQPGLYGDGEAAGGAEILQDIRHDVGEQDLVPQALFTDQQQGLAGEVITGRPLRPVDHESGDVGELRVQACFVLLPTFADSAEIDQDGGAGEPHHDAFAFRLGLGQGGLAIFERLRDVAERQVHVAAIVAGFGEAGIETQGFVEEQLGVWHIPLFGHHCAQSVPNHRLVGVEAEGGLEQVDGFVSAPLIAQDAGQIVGALRMVGEMRQEVTEQLFRDFRLAQAIGEAPQVVGDLRVVRQQGQSRLITLDRSGEVAAHLLGDGQEVPAEAALLVLLQGAQRQGHALLGVPPVQGVDGLLQQGFSPQRAQLS